MGEMLWKRDTQGEYQAAGYTIYRMPGSGRWCGLAPVDKAKPPLTPRRVIAVRETLKDVKREVAKDVPLSCDVVPLDGHGDRLPIPHAGEVRRMADGSTFCERHAAAIADE